MKLTMTEALTIDLDSETWHCRKCDHEIGPAAQSYKHGLKVRARDPGEVHQSILDDRQYSQTFAPRAEWVCILEYCCPSCALLVEAEYLPPGHPPVMDIELDVASLRRVAEHQS